MEELLSQIVAVSNNFPQIEKAAREAVDFLGIQQGLIRDPAYELREKCLLVLQLCLETKKNKFTALAVAGLQKIIRDDRFHSNIEPDDDSKWLPLQLLQATNAFLRLSDDTQVDILKIFLNIACSKKWTMNGRTLICILGLCSEAFESGNTGIKSAAQAAASQTIRSFCLILEEEFEESSDVSNFNEIIPVMQFICSKIDEVECSSHCEQGLVFLLECLLTICSSLPQSVCMNIHLRTFFWQKLCPVLISVLGTPKVDKNIVTRSSNVEKEHGRGSGGLNTAPSFNSCHAKTIYSINTELVRLFGTTASLRPVLESVFHRVLLYPAPEHRLGALKASAELLRNANRLLDICGPMIQEKNGLPVSDMSLLRLIMDSVQESSNSIFPVMEASVMCCFGLLKAIEEICSGSCIQIRVAEIVNEIYPNLDDCDYEGPRTYQCMTRLPQNYREKIEEENELLKRIYREENNQDGQVCESDSSGDTEGPEEEVDERNERKTDAIETKQISMCLGLDGGPIGLDDTDRQRARHFVSSLNELLPQLVPMRSSIQVDQALQSFASQYCEGTISGEKRGSWSAVKAEGIYMAIYSALLLDMRLFQTGYYTSPTKHIQITEDDFVREVKGVGVVAYLSGVWLRELYQIMVTSSLLHKYGYLPVNHNSQPHALINLLTDVEGLGSCKKGSQMLWECRRLEKPIPGQDDNVESDAGLRISRQILTCSWDTVLEVLSVPLSKKRFKSRLEKLRYFKILRNENHCKQDKQLITTTIEGLQILTRLCNDLGLQERCGSILELLATASCVDSTVDKNTKLMRLQPSNDEIVRLTSSHFLSLELLLGSGLELGSHCSDSWPHVFQCCIYVKKLEHKYFSKSENRILGSTTKVTRKEENSNTLKNDNLTFEPQTEEDSCVDVYSFLCSSEVSQPVSELVSTVNYSATDILKPSDTAKVICVLSQLVDKLFEDAAMKLNLKSLEYFSLALCACSHEQLFPNTSKTSTKKRYWWQRFVNAPESSDNPLLLDSVGEVLLKSVRSGRPLFHVMKIWSLVAPYLMEAACHKDLTISRKAVKHLHDTINAALTVHSELPYFHITEVLFKPFENLLCLEMCEPDIQDQIVGCICEFVEANFREIRSGWRPLFGSLRAMSTNVNILLDVFRVFLETDNVLVFSYAAVDYIMCLLKHLRTQSTCNNNTDVGFEILKYLKRCQSVLSSMYRMPHCVTFHSADHIQVSDGLLVDPVVMDFEVFNFDNIPEDLRMESEIHQIPLDCDLPLDTIDRSGGVLRVWFLLFEGVHSAVISANSTFQPPLLNILYDDLGKLIEDPGPTFGLIIVNRLTLPMTQSWLRQLSRMQEGDFSGLKQSIGLLSDLVLHYFDRLQNDKTCESLLNLLLNQILLLLSECSIHPISAVARLGPACIRHIIMSFGKRFTQEQWKCVTTGLYRTCDMTLSSLRQLMIPFSRDSQCYYGDADQVKVAARRPSDEHDLHYSIQLSQMVFLLDEQHEAHDFALFRDDQKIYTFLIQNSQEEIIRVPMKSLVIALQAHQSVLQIIADLLLQGTTHHIPGLFCATNKSVNDTSDDRTKDDNHFSMPGFMDHLNTSDFRRLLRCLDYSYNCALAFDSRPGLKFLIQKVAGLEQAANLYKQAGATWTIKLVSLFEYCLALTKRQNLTIETVKSLLHRTDTVDESDLAFFFNNFQCAFNELCRIYIEVVVSNRDERKRNEEKCEKPLYFLIASQEDEVFEGEKKSKENDEAEDHKPFRLSDFSKLSELVDSNEGGNIHHEQIDLVKEEPETLDEVNPSVPEDAEMTQEVADQINDKEIHEEESMLNVLMEYKKKKKTYTEQRRTTLKSSNEPPVPPEIEQQRRHSFLKDGEALRRVWTEMLSSAFHLIRQLTDEEFQRLLPVFIGGVRQLMANVTDPKLKLAVSEFFQRISVVYGFGIL